MKKLALAIMLGLGVMVSGCGNTNNVGQVNNTQQTQQVQEDKGISLGKALDLAKKGQFTPQKVKFEGTITNKVFGDEPEIIVTDWVTMGDLHKPVKIHITDPEVIKNVAKMQEERKNNYVHGTGSVNASEIVFNEWSIEVK